MNNIMKVGLVQHNAYHSEVFGPLMSLCKTFGYECIIYQGQDRLSMVPLFMEWLDMKDVTVKDVHCIKTDAAQLDKIVLVTSDEWKPSNGWNEPRVFPGPYNDKLILVHHDTHYCREGDVSFLLTPFKGTERWIFPLYKIPNTPVDVFHDGVAIVGSINNNHNKTRDMGDIYRYLERGHVLHVFARGPEHAPVHFKNLRGRWGLSSEAMINELRSIRYFWFPIDQKSWYSNRIFTGGLSLAVNMRKIMIMPRSYADAYGLADCAITYESSIEEVDFSAVQEKALMDALERWCEETWARNKTLFASLTARNKTE